jgi:pyruvate formate lyase activating enzyme
MGFGDCTKTGDGAFIFREGKLKINRDRIEDIRDYMEICPSKAISVVGCMNGVKKILEEIEKDLFFYQQSEGGITLTGGEPFAQSKWLLNLVQDLYHKKISVSAETCLYVSWEKIHPFIPFIDEFLVDLKHVDPVKFKSFTGGDLDLVLNNLDNLDNCGAAYRLRIPVIPTFNHSMIEMEKLIDFATKLQHCHRIDFIPYHRLGVDKYKMIGKSYPIQGVSAVRMEELIPYVEYAKKKGFLVTIGG